MCACMCVHVYASVCVRACVCVYCVCVVCVCVACVHVCVYVKRLCYHALLHLLKYSIGFSHQLLQEHCLLLQVRLQLAAERRI